MVFNYFLINNKNFYYNVVLLILMDLNLLIYNLKNVIPKQYSFFYIVINIFKCDPFGITSDSLALMFSQLWILVIGSRVVRKVR